MRNWIKSLLDPLLDHLATKLALKVRAQLDGAIDAALDRAEDRIDTAFEGLEERLQAAATKPIADLKVRLGGPVLELQRRYGVEATEKPALELQQQIEAISPDYLRSRLTPPRPWKEIPDQ